MKLPLRPRTSFPTALLPILLLALLPGAFAQPAPRGISALSWLAGSWSGTADGVTSEEHWTSAEGDGLVGMHKDIQGGKMSAFEFLRIEVDAQGRVCYISMPGGAPPTSFCAIEIAERRVVFENRAHDFPQRILYWLDTSGKLHARIEGPVEGKEAAMDWVWEKRDSYPFSNSRQATFLVSPDVFRGRPRGFSWILRSSSASISET